MTSRIAVPLLAVSLLAAPAFGLDPSPKPSPAASPAKIVSSPKPTATPAKHTARKAPPKKIAAVRPATHGHAYTGATTPPNTAAPNTVAK
ncbi:MAG: hypothetical protein HY271_14885 [Deltaproteobacteria bacterium]|nr:hypothetical protein [Deltaproteobacteria bacterium]